MPLGRALSAALLMVATAVLTSCASTGGFSDLDRPAQENDSRPQDITLLEDEEAEIVPDSSRLVGTHEAVELWLVRTDADGVCLVAYPEDGDWVAGCSELTPLGIGGQAGSFIVIADGEDAPENATRVSENVFAR